MFRPYGYGHVFIGKFLNLFIYPISEIINFDNLILYISIFLILQF